MGERGYERLVERFDIAERRRDRRPLRKAAPCGRVNVLTFGTRTRSAGPGKTILETYRGDRSGHVRPAPRRLPDAARGGETPFHDAPRARSGMPVHVIRGYNQYDPRMIVRVVELVKRLEIDIVHAHEVKSDVIAYLASRSTACRS